MDVSIRCTVLLLLSLILLVNSECPSVVTKKQWGGRPNQNVDYLLIPIKNVIIIHTASLECNTTTTCTNSIINIQNYHMNTLNYNDIAYNFIVGGDGDIYEGVGWHRIGAHTYKWNSKSIGIAFIGDFSDKLPSTLAMENVKKLLQCGIDAGKLDTRFNLYGHRQVSNTQSPGTKFYREITNWPHYSLVVYN